MFQCMFLCAGLGTRLRPLTDELPKPLVPLGDRPMLEHLIDYVVASGGTPKAVNTHHRPEKFLEWQASRANSWFVSHEPKLLGTAGGLAAVRQHFSAEPVVVWNGDIWAKPDLLSLVHACRGAVAALAVVERRVGEGTCGLDVDGNVVRLRGERFGEECVGADYMGVLAMTEPHVRQVPVEGCLVGDYLLPELRSGKTVRGLFGHGEFSDIGTPAVYLEENLRWLRRRALDSARYIHESASVSTDVEVIDSVIGAGATVQGFGCLERVVVWPGATATAPLSDAVVTPRYGAFSVLAKNSASVRT